MKKALLVSFWMGLATCFQPAVAQTAVTINLKVEGPGVASFGAPRPHLIGQSLELRATPVPGARFVRWDDSLTAASRTITVNTDQTEFTAIFELIPFDPNPDFSGRGGQPIESFSRPRVSSPEFVNGRLRISVNLGQTHRFRVFSSTQLGRDPFAPIPFALSSNAPPNVEEKSGGPGVVELWVALPSGSASGFYLLQLDSGDSVPVLFFADVSKVAPGGDVTLHGDNLLGTVAARSDATTLPAESLAKDRVRVTVPTSPGQLEIRVIINGVQAIGSVPVTVVPSAEAPRVDSLPQLLTLAEGVLRITGTGFQPNSTVWLDDKLMQIIGRSADATELYVKLPDRAGEGRLSVDSAGVRSAPRILTIFSRQSLFTKVGVLPVAVYAHVDGSADIHYRPAVLPVSVFAFVPGEISIPYRPFVLPVRVEAP